MSVKILRAAIAVFVVIFVIFVVVSLKRGRRQTSATPAAPRMDPNATTEMTGSGKWENFQQGTKKLSVEFGKQLSYADGRIKLFDGVKVNLPDKGGRSITIEGRQVEMTKPPDKDIGKADFSGGVTLTTSDGVVIKAATASYDDTTAIAQIPGPLTFSKGRMRGKGNGATYDRTREVLWILDQAQVDVQPDEAGSGAAHMTSKRAGMARLAHVLKFAGDARLAGEGRVTEADEITVYLTPDDERIQRLELRGNSRITAAPGASGGPQAMRARDIDLAYADDGRTLQTAHLVENAAVQLPGTAGHGRRRVAGRNIDIALAPDGATVTSLTANENVQVDLPADGDIPARRIKSAALIATGAPPAGPGQAGGLQNAAFAGNVEFHESRAARKNVAAVNRSARSERLDVKTKPGFGDVESADFRGRVHFTDGTDTTADAPVALYAVNADRLDLGPPVAGETGMGPHVTNARLQVDAAHIQMTLSSQSMKADTAVRSLLKPGNDPTGNDRTDRTDQAVGSRTPAGRGGRGTPPPVPEPAAGSRVPAMLKQDKPVNVRSNRLEYDGPGGIATYSGSARLWQEDTTIQADTIVLEDKTGNLHATTSVRTIMTLTEPPNAGKPEPSSKVTSQQTTTVAEELLYEDAKHRVTYTTKAHMNGPEGDVTADKIELYLAEQGGQLERAEAYGSVVSRQETRRAYGNHLTYLAAKDEYTMVGTPVKVFDDTPPNCKVTIGATLTFTKAADTIRSSGNEVSGTKTQSIACGTVGQF